MGSPARSCLDAFITESADRIHEWLPDLCRRARLVLNDPRAEAGASLHDFAVALLALESRLAERDAEVAELWALLERGRDIVAEYAPGHGVWLDAADLALNPPTPETTT